MARPPSRDIVQVSYTPRAHWRARGSHSTRLECLSCQCKRFKISLEVAALDVAVPFMVTLNGDVTILAPAAVDELIAEVNCHNARQYTRLMRGVDGHDDELINIMVPLLYG
jgi:hypothetical protein